MADRWRCATKFKNNITKMLQCDDVERNPTYVVGVALSYPITYLWMEMYKRKVLNLNKNENEFLDRAGF